MASVLIILVWKLYLPCPVSWTKLLTLSLPVPVASSCLIIGTAQLPTLQNPLDFEIAVHVASKTEGSINSAN